ncbi:MAG: DUF4411 family protein [Candidatus Helarchaeota archaeon]
MTQTRLAPLYPHAKYSFDTSAFIEPWRRHYAIDIFPSLWKKIKNLIMNDVILITSAVKDELERQRDDLYEFINDLNHFVQPTQEEQDIVRQLVNHPNFDKWGTSNKHYADPFVVALASCHHLIVSKYMS